MAEKLSATAEETKIVQIIVFKLGGDEYAANIDQVTEIITVGPIAPVPDSPDFIKGVANVRGDIIVAIGLRSRFSMHTGEEVQARHAIITEQDNNLYGLMVDEVTEVLRIPETDIKPAPKLVTQIDGRYIPGVVTREDRLIILLDLEKVLSAEELVKLSEFAKWQRTTAVSEAEAASTATEPDSADNAANDAGAGGNEIE